MTTSSGGVDTADDRFQHLEELTDETQLWWDGLVVRSRDWLAGLPDRASLAEVVNSLAARRLFDGSLSFVGGVLIRERPDPSGQNEAVVRRIEFSGSATTSPAVRVTSARGELVACSGDGSLLVTRVDELTSMIHEWDDARCDYVVCRRTSSDQVALVGDDVVALDHSNGTLSIQRLDDHESIAQVDVELDLRLIQPLDESSLAVALRTEPYEDTEIILFRLDGTVTRTGPVPALVDPITTLADGTLVVRSNLFNSDFELLQASAPTDPDSWRTFWSSCGDVVQMAAGQVVAGQQLIWVVTDHDGSSSLRGLRLSAGSAPTTVVSQRTVAFAGHPLIRDISVTDGPVEGGSAIIERLDSPGEVVVFAGGSSNAVPALDGPVTTLQVSGLRETGLVTTVHRVGPADLPVAMLADDRGPRAKPTLVVVYGGFGIPSNLGHNPLGTAWAKLGGRFVVAGVRGGGERGEAWHQAAVGIHKHLSADDLNTATEWLVDNGYAIDRSIGVIGGSNGAMVAAAAVARAPGRYRCAVLAAPVLDLLRFHRLGIGDSWADEYGDPDAPNDAEALRRLSPYHACLAAPEKWPPVLLALFADDEVVHHGHARKMAAALMTSSGPEGPPSVVVRMAKTGLPHGTASSHRSVDMIAFLRYHIGLEP